MLVVGSLECFSPTDGVVKLEKPIDLSPTSPVFHPFVKENDHTFGGGVRTVTQGCFASFWPETGDCGTDSVPVSVHILF